MYNGDVGGIVGRADRTATVEHCATGQDWAVLVTRIDDSRNTEGTDNTCAGIIGYNAADKDLIGLENFARVRKCNLSGNFFIGAGIIGRQEKITSSSWRVASCTNYGNVETGYRAGGIIGQWKYNGGTLINCANYGYINATKGSAGGIVGSTFGASVNQRYNITACFNNGTIKGANSGGIVGEANASSQRAYTIILDCVNTGSADSGGILGIQSGNMSAEISRSISYYYNSNSPDTYGFVGGGKSTVAVRNSIRVPQNDSNPIGAKGTRKLNFMLRTGTARSVATDTVLIPMGVVASGTSLKAEGSVGAVKYVIPELALDPNAYANEGQPYANYLAINHQLVAFLKSLYNGVPANPRPVTVSTSDGTYLATWTNAANAYQYEVTVEVGSGDTNANFVASNTTVYTALENRLSFAIDSKYENKGLKYRVSVVTINGNGARSATATTATLKNVLTSLVMPKAQYEIVYENNALKGRWRLLNYDEYTKAYGTNTDVLSGINVSGSFQDGKSVGTFTVAEKQSTSTPIGGTNNSLTTTVNATGTNYIDSLTFSVQTQRYDSDKLTTTEETYQFTEIPKIGGVLKIPYLSGIRPDELVCRVTLKMKDKDQVLRRTELVVTNTDLGEGVEVVIAESHNDRITATHDLSMKLTDKLEGEQPYIVRSYPWGTQGVADGGTYIHGCAYGHDVAKNVSRASLTDVVDPWATGTTIYNDNGTTKTLTKGYVLSLNDDGTYDVYYSVMLASTATPTNAQGQFIIRNMKAPEAVAAPVLNPTFTTLTNGSSQFTWTATDTTAADKYEATVLATTFDNREINVVIPADAIVNTAKGGSLTLNLSTGNYRSVKVAITRLGAETSAGTTLLGSTSEPVTYAIPRKLPTMGAPGVRLKDKTEVQYIVSWSPEQSFAGNDTQGYTLWLATNSTLASPTALATPSTLAPNTTTTTVDLEAYQSQQVWLYLTAHCVASPTNYTEDSGNGATTMNIVAGRISLSTATDITLSDGYVLGTATTVERFNNELSLRARDLGNTAPGSFVMQAIILPTNTTLPSGDPVATDTGLIVAWDGSTPATKAMNSLVSNSLSVYSSYALKETDGFSDDYAAMWVCARVRAASASNEREHLINSTWSEYKWMRLPRVQLDAPHSEEHTAEPLYYAATSVTYSVIYANNDDPGTMTLQQPALEWTWDEHAKDCIITIEGKDATDNDVTYGIQLSRDVTGTVRAMNTSVPTTPTTMTGTVDLVASTTTFTWNQSLSSAAVPQYGDMISYRDSDARQCIVNVETRLIVTNTIDVEGNLVTTCKLMLPDYDEVTEINRDAVFNTKSVALQYMPIEPERYEASLPVTWAWANLSATTFAANSYVFNGGLS